MRRLSPPIAGAIAFVAALLAPLTPALSQDKPGGETPLDFDQARARGIEALESDRPKEAVELFARCIELEPDRPEPYYHTARAHGRLGDADESVRWLALALRLGFTDFAAIERDPDLAEARKREDCRELLAFARRVVAQGAWGMFVETEISFELLPEERHADVAALAGQWQAMDYEPSEEEVERIWEERAPPGMPLPEQLREEIEALVRRDVFVARNAGAIEVLRQAAAEGLLARLAARGDFDDDAPATIVVVPFPCPNRGTYDLAARFVDAACAAAQRNGARVVIVRAPYGETANIKKAEERNWWWAWISNLPKRYDAFIIDGTAEITDEFPGRTSTPWGFLFRGRELVLEGNIAKWARDPAAALDQLFAPEKDAPEDEPK